jgi:hypothetical protein
MVLVALSLIALIGSAALVLLAGSAEWQKNQLQQLADQAALDSALKIGIGCDAAKATAIITEADNFLATQRTRTGALSIAGGVCAAPYTGTDTFAGGLSETINYPYRAHQQQVEVVLTLTLPISFGGVVGKTSTTLVRRAVAQALPGSTSAVSATTLTCSSGQVNVAGSVLAQNLIVRSGTCALYAHARFDAASSTYSDLGNVSVYTDGQTWTAPGTCAVGNSGSKSAICADGFELSGHTAPACAAAATSYLLAGDKTINPNPCAAGTGPQPVPPLSTTLPPEPNTDASAIATLQGTGGAACTAAGVYNHAIVVGGSTVATGTVTTPVPVKDASGFYHFKPSCYGYLNPSSLSGGGGGITNRQTGPEAGPATGTLTLTLPANSQAGTLLVATLRSETSPSRKPFTAPAGWVSAVAGGAFLDGTAHTEIWYYPNNPGGIASVDFGVSPASINAVGLMTEWSGVAAASPLDKTGVVTVSSNQASVTISTSAAMTTANELVITDLGSDSDQSPENYTPGAGWTSLVSDSNNLFASQYRLSLPAGVASETVTGSQATAWAVMIASFKPAAGGGPGAVLDPGFYYFNGSGFAGGGGICLNGGTLLARDVTLEFVNQAGFSSGTCAAGGGAACAAAACQFGSTPCSLSACPPNTAADSPNNLTWFAAPCSTAPTGDAASCPASAWCTAGDRACSNVLIWAPASNTGQFAIKGVTVKHWLLGSIYWPGTCTDSVNGTSTISGTLFCGPLSISAGAGAGFAVGGNYGIATSLVEAVLVE